MIVDKGCAETDLIPENEDDVRILNELYDSIKIKDSNIQKYEGGLLGMGIAIVFITD